MSTAQAVSSPRTPGQIGPKAWATHHQVPSFFILTFAISWSSWLIAYLSGDGILRMVLFFVGGFGPAISGAAITWFTGDSLREWAIPIVRWRVSARYYLYALGLPALLWTLINIELALLGQDIDLSLLPGRLIASVRTFFLVLTIGGALEEPGWRGFALVRLQNRLSPMRATLLLGFVWGLWHVPLYGPLGFAFPMVLAFFYTFLYYKTRSVLLPILLHASFTPASDNLTLMPHSVHGITDLVIFGTVLAAVVVLVFVTRGRLGYRAGRA
ncbi:MAG: CPBP family intramembrane glutamic endopeptidase [Actinomycetota bacterium]